MNIGIDIDGVLTDIQGFHHKYAPRFFKRKFKRDFIDETPYDIRDMFQCSEEERYAYWKRYLFKYVITKPARKGAKSVIRKLNTDGHRVYIISKRVFTCQDNFMGKLMRFIVRNWLWRNGIRYHEIIFCDNDVSDSKKTACLKNNIDVMVEDEPININAITPITRVICFDVSYNRDCVGDNILRAKDWEEVYRILKEIINKKDILV
jgi:uncharacterized HAD superfamily protein